MPSITLYNIPAFDATKEQQITFDYRGPQAVENMIRVYDNITNQMLYEKRIRSMAHINTIDEDRLVNGNTYKYQFIVYYREGSSLQSITSDMSKPFRCISSPTFRFLNPNPNNNIINNASFDAVLEYNQLEKNPQALNDPEPLSEYNITIYSSNMSVFWNSGAFYNSTSPIHKQIPINITGLQDGAMYRIRAEGKTQNGFNLDTGFIPFSVRYESTMLYQVLRLENRENEGAVRIAANIVDITGKSYPNDLTYIDDEMVDLSEDGSYVLFNNGFNLSQNFTIMINLCGLVQNKIFIVIGNEAIVTWRVDIHRDENGKMIKYAFAELLIDGRSKYIALSNNIANPKIDDIIHIWIRRVNRLYEIKIANKGVV